MPFSFTNRKCGGIPGGATGPSVAGGFALFQVVVFNVVVEEVIGGVGEVCSVVVAVDVFFVVL